MGNTKLLRWRTIVKSSPRRPRSIPDKDRDRDREGIKKKTRRRRDHHFKIVQTNFQSRLADAKLAVCNDSEETCSPLSLPERDTSHGPFIIQYANLSQKFSPLLDLYDLRLCSIPLTYDCTANPLRCRRESSQGSRFLLHAILALSLHHMAFESTESKDSELALEAANHHSSALLLYQAALNKPNVNLALLDTLLILMHFEMTQSAISTWCIHIHGAFNLIEICGGVGMLDTISSKSRAQILLLVWRDVGLSFIHRQMPVFPKTYLTQLSKYDYTDGWSVLGLTGCPPSIVRKMYDLALLAFEYERSTRPSHEPFDLSTIHKLVQRITSLENDYHHTYSHNDMGNVDDVSVSTSTYHLFEAWRNCVLLYTNRVFLEHNRSPKIMCLSRLILDHISCIREESDLQKQVLLPLFLAGAEAQNEDDRAFCRAFCAKMLSKTTYALFTDIQVILEQIWADTESNISWWGSFISGRSHEIRGMVNAVPQLLIA